MLENRVLIQLSATLKAVFMIRNGLVSHFHVWNKCIFNEVGGCKNSHSKLLHKCTEIEQFCGKKAYVHFLGVDFETTSPRSEKSNHKGKSEKSEKRKDEMMK